ncbi:unnamed protein product [Rotaria sordida]|uniref:Uncharacterized protein n=1 Tax=Rotaria sordida TaxID=392033 RepID=A0A819NY05_9BILA|nr:unnamed protein product [Rotaria sordida]
MKKAPISIDMQNITTMINNLINKDQNQLRLELERRKTMLRLDAEEHRPVEKFYVLKPRQTEINSAKIIWKAINERENIIHEIAIFKKWLAVHAQESTYSLHILPAEHIAEQTITKAEEIVQHYTKIATIEKNKLQSTKSHHKNADLLEPIIHAIFQRVNNMQQRRENELQAILTNIFKLTPVQHINYQIKRQHD